MFSMEQREKAIETFIRFGHSHADAIAELGYPTPPTPKARRVGIGPVPVAEGDPGPQWRGWRSAPGRGLSVDGGIDGLPDGVGQLQDMLREVKPQPRQVQLEPDIREATPEIMKKSLGTDPNRLTNREKAELVDRLRAKWRLKGLLPAVGMAKSSYEHARAARLGGEAAERAAAREAVVSAFEGSGGAYGYRRIWKQVNAGSGARIGERTVRAIVAEGGLAARTPKRGGAGTASTKARCPRRPPTCSWTREESTTSAPKPRTGSG